MNQFSLFTQENPALFLLGEQVEVDALKGWKTHQVLGVLAGSKGTRLSLQQW